MDTLLHAALMIAGFLSLVTGGAVAFSMKKKRWWLQYHQTAGLLGTAILAAGILAGMVMVAMASERHFKVIHSQAGALAFLAACMTAVLGRLQFKVRNQAKRLRIIHRWLGRATLLMLLVVLVLGLFTAGIL